MSPRRRPQPVGDALFDTGEALFEVNPSKLQCWLDCPRQYRYLYVERRSERRGSPEAALGRSVHIALREFYGRPPAERTLDVLLGSLKRSWDRSAFRSRRASDDARQRAEQMLRRYHSSSDHGNVRTIALESKFATPHSEAGVLVTGRIDRLDADDEGYVIVDYKTGRFRQRAADVEASLPLSLYAIAVSGRFGREVSRIELHHLASGERTRTVRDLPRLESDWDALRREVAQIRVERDFPARPGPLCRSCHFLSVCPEGQEHVARRQAADARPD